MFLPPGDELRQSFQNIMAIEERARPAARTAESLIADAVTHAHGVRELSVLKDVPGFDIVEGHVPDLMDIVAGQAHHLMKMLSGQQDVVTSPNIYGRYVPAARLFWRNRKRILRHV